MEKETLLFNLCEVEVKMDEFLGMPIVYWIWNVAFAVWGLYVAYKVYKIEKMLRKN